ncbi:methyltransferase domain-containing protein [uncultured Wocania sp.]|jgi:cyclopropane fatty-acyl-phospholipid synthase-like methyltransferase|uniref:methyltransferase domain-containing protein n=1 Tax=uncultured Wocania sp. TaxID=2834404 RepID=UPI0030FC3002
MKRLKNWDNKTWLSSKSYISQFHKFLKTKVNLNKNSKILDIGCGRANIISVLQKKYKFKNKSIGIDVVANKDIKKNIIFKKIDALKYLKKQKKYDLILIKQTVHFFSKTNLNRLLNLAQNSLNPKGKILIFSLKTKNNKIPCFKKMRKNLEKSLKRDEALFKIIKKNLKAISYTNFNFRVNISKQKYVRMLRERYISCLLNMSDKDIKLGISEIKLKYKNQIKFTDTLKCISYRK